MDVARLPWTDAEGRPAPGSEVLVLSALPEDDPEGHIAGRIAGTLNVQPSTVTVTIAGAPALLQAPRRCAL